MFEFSPVIIFVYGRVDHLKKTVESLKKNKDSNKTKLYIFSDGAKKQSDVSNVNNVREFCRNIKGFKSIKIIKRQKNFGLSKNIINGISRILKISKTAIILEDDMCCDENFLSYMNFFLKKYETNSNVVSIHGYNYPLADKKNLPQFFFIKGADCWGWATWSLKWKIYNNNAKVLAERIKKKGLIKEFNFNNNFNYYQMLLNSYNKKNDSWAIKWYASAFLKNKLTLHPKYSLINNIGMDGSGRHSSKTNIFNVKLRNKFLNPGKQKIPLKENILAREKIEFFFNRFKENIFKKIFLRIKNAF